MGNIVSKNNKDYINSNWNDLKCSPVGPLLQATGIAPGNASETANQCQSNSFSSQFNSSMTDQFKATDKLNSGLGKINGTMNKFRGMMATIQQQIFKDLSRVADMIFGIYVKIGNIIMVINKNLVNILMVFKNVINTADALAILLIAFLNLIRVPVNGLIKFIKAFCFSPNTILKLKNGKKVKMKNIKLGDIIHNGSKVLGVMKISNFNDEYYYKIKSKNGKRDIYVTGSHYIYHKIQKKYIQVKDHPEAVLTDKKDKEFSCLITDDHKIKIGGLTFWDYDDDYCTNK